jgi:hypothetical protein
MKRLAATSDVVASAPQTLNALKGAVEASRGTYWHRCAQEGKSAVYRDGAGGTKRETNPNGAREIPRSARGAGTGEDFNRGFYGERVGGEVFGGVGPRIRILHRCTGCGLVE